MTEPPGAFIPDRRAALAFFCSCTGAALLLGLALIALEGLL